ncbi:hypothetical protein DPMN_183128 [Dreissena polymorpha]|uniref:Uncharacterized protein n=1 Tax=Dreissena polymorpha TaxID=45954 RepID=A0A9D4DHM3_DREPO|nr:hypothetical protein DPMN_183128 [Dreissena polymorpha]
MTGQTRAGHGYQDRELYDRPGHGMVSRTGNCMTDRGMEWFPGQGNVRQTRAWNGYRDKVLFEKPLLTRAWNGYQDRELYD